MKKISTIVSLFGKDYFKQREAEPSVKIQMGKDMQYKKKVSPANSGKHTLLQDHTITWDLVERRPALKKRKEKEKEKEKERIQNLEKKKSLFSSPFLQNKKDLKRHNLFSREE